MFSIVRTIYVFVRLLPFLVSILRDYQRFVVFGSPRSRTPGEHELRAKNLTRLIAQLGPTFIKATQVLGMREDVLPRVYTRQFKTLQDRVPPFPTECAMQILEEDLGRPVEDVFESLDPTPIAAASLGQVHRAVYQGRPVAVKIRRPRIEKLIEADLAAVLFLVRFSNLFVDSFILRNLWTALVDFRRMISVEMDFRNESRHAKRLRENLKRHPRVLVPECIESLTTERISVFEYHEGCRIDDVGHLQSQGITSEDLVGLLIEVYVSQAVLDGYIHADPHPGNLLIDREGRLVILDFGMVLDIDPPVRKELLRLVIAVVRNDIETIVDCFYRLRMVEPQINTAVLRDAARTLMNISIGTEYSPRRIQEICEDIYSTFHRFPIRLPQGLVYLLRASALVEGIGISFDPNFNGVRVARPIVKRLVAEEIKEIDRTAVEWIYERVHELVRVWDDFNRLLYRAERDQLHVRIHPADLTQIERYYQAMIRRILGGLCCVGVALVAMGVYLRTGHIVYLVAGSLVALGGIAVSALLPLRKKVILRNDGK